MDPRPEEQDPQDDEFGARSTRRFGGAERAERTERPARTDRFGVRGSLRGEESETGVGRDWRSSRTASRSGRRAAGLPTSGQELALWLQRGGWMVVAGVSAVVLVIILLLVLSQGARPMATPTQEATNNTNETQFQLPTTTPVLEPSPEPLVQPGGAQFTVVGTGVEGLFLRPNPNTQDAPITTLPEGTIVTVVGSDFVGPDRVWKNIRTTEGFEGWVASDFVRPLQ
ncbi:MAG TPA: SH3 domain-containing protein [Roseiflexaceae bacterium]|nr:SH3 domain-containing protein [Roseiflexaceae bacterium]